MAKYSEKAQDKVHKALHEEKEGTLKSGRSGKSNQPETGDRHRFIGSTQGRCQGT